MVQSGLQRKTKRAQEAMTVNRNQVSGTAHLVMRVFTLSDFKHQERQ